MSIVTLGLVIVLIIVVAMLIAFFASAKQTKTTTSQEDFPNLSFDSQALYRPIRSLKRSIIETTESSSDPAILAMAGSVRQEAQDAHDRVVNALEVRDRLRKVIESHSNVEGEVERLLKLRNEADDAQEKLNYTKAYESKTGELAEYKRGKELIKQIEQEVELVKASLGDLKAKLSVSTASSGATLRAEELRSSLGSLETIQSSVDEAQKLFNS